MNSSYVAFYMYFEKETFLIIKMASLKDFVEMIFKKILYGTNRSSKVTIIKVKTKNLIVKY